MWNRSSCDGAQIVFLSRWHARFTYSPSAQIVQDTHRFTAVLYHCRLLQGNSRFKGLDSRSHCTNGNNALITINNNKNKLLWAMMSGFDDATVLSPLDTLNLLFVVRLLKSSSSRSIYEKRRKRIYSIRYSKNRFLVFCFFFVFLKGRWRRGEVMLMFLEEHTYREINIRKWENFNFNARCWGSKPLLFSFFLFELIGRNLFQFLDSLPIEEDSFHLLL